MNHIRSHLLICLLLNLPFCTFAATLRLAMVPKHVNNPFFIATGKGCQAAAAELGDVQCIFRGSLDVGNLY